MSAVLDVVPSPRERRAWRGGRTLLALACAAGALCGAGAVVGAAPPAWFALGDLALLAAAIACGVAWPASGVFARPLLAVSTSRLEVALTFDDGPNPDLTPAILEALEARGHRATFFVVGSRAERHPELLAEITRRGHGLANHSYRHSPLTPFRSPTALARELRRVGELLPGARGARFFRAPVGLLSPRVSAAARLAGLDLVGWTASARDGGPWTTERGALRRLVPHLAPGAILVLHDGPRALGRPPLAPVILPRLLDELDRRGLRSVPLDELLK